MFPFIHSVQSDPAPSEGEGSAFDQLFSLGDVWNQLEPIWLWISSNILQVSVLIELGLVGLAFMAAGFAGPWFKKRVARHIVPRAPKGIARRAAVALGHLTGPLVFFLMLNVISIGVEMAEQSRYWISAAVSLTFAWVMIRIVTLVIRSKFWSQVAFYVVWPVTALDIFGVLDDIIVYLEAAAIPLGVDAAGMARNLSALDVLRGFLAFALFFWVAHLASKFLAKRIYEIEDLTPSLRTLIVKILNILLPVLAFFLALQLIGVNLAALAVFSGALGLGVGLGLQKSVSNLISGFTLVADKSIKPGDVVSVADTFGWVTSLGARYVAVRTRDGTEHLVPNDQFIEQGVINWSHADKVVRLHAPFGVSYATKDLKRVREIAYEALKDMPRVLQNPGPQCNMMGFGDSSIDFDLRFWINDPENGKANVTSEVFLALHQKLMESGIEIPFPQRDLHVRSVSADAASSLEGSKGP